MNLTQATGTLRSGLHLAPRGRPAQWLALVSWCSHAQRSRRSHVSSGCFHADRSSWCSRWCFLGCIRTVIACSIEHALLRFLLQQKRHLFALLCLDSLVCCYWERINVDTAALRARTTRLIRQPKINNARFGCGCNGPRQGQDGSHQAAFLRWDWLFLYDAQECYTNTRQT